MLLPHLLGLSSPADMTMAYFVGFLCVPSGYIRAILRPRLPLHFLSKRGLTAMGSLRNLSISLLLAKQSSSIRLAIPLAE